MTPYPVSLPLEDIQLLIEDIRGGSSKLVGDKARFGKALWVLMGYALKSTLGDPTPVSPGHNVAQAVLLCAHAPDLTNEQVATSLEQLLPHKAGVCAALPIPWIAILKWALKILIASL